MTNATPWHIVKAHLEREGKLVNGVGRRVQATACRRCHAPTLTALDADICARTAVVDPDPLSALGEALAVLAGRNTWSLVRRGDRYELLNRDRWTIRGKPAGTPDRDVCAEHACAAPPLPSIPSVHRPTAATDYTGPPPF